MRGYWRCAPLVYPLPTLRHCGLTVGIGCGRFRGASFVYYHVSSDSLTFQVTLWPIMDTHRVPEDCRDLERGARPAWVHYFLILEGSQILSDVFLSRARLFFKSDSI